MPLDGFKTACNRRQPLAHPDRQRRPVDGAVAKAPSIATSPDRSAATEPDLTRANRYPGMAKEAREAGRDDIADWFETLARAERARAGRGKRALELIAT